MKEQELAKYPKRVIDYPKIEKIMVMTYLPDRIYVQIKKVREFGRYL